jgi:hypothetical protein
LREAMHVLHRVYHAGKELVEELGDEDEKK